MDNIIQTTEGIGWYGNTWCESCPWYQLAWQIFIGFPLSQQANVAVVLQRSHDHFLPSPFQLITQQSVIVGWWIPILKQLNGYSLLILCTVCRDIGRLVSGKFRQQAVNHSSGDWSVGHVQMKNEYAAGWWSCAVGTFLLPHNSKVDWDCLQSFVMKADQNTAQLTCWLNMWHQTMRLPTYCQNGSDMSFVGQEPEENGHAGCKALEEYRTSQDVGRSVHVYVCEVPYPVSMLSRAGKVQQLNRTNLKSVSGIWTRDIHKLG